LFDSSAAQLYHQHNVKIQVTPVLSSPSGCTTGEASSITNTAVVNEWLQSGARPKIKVKSDLELLASVASLQLQN
jgi:hypothetical protein